MFEVMTDTTTIEPTIHKDSYESEDLLALLYDWLDELIFLRLRVSGIQHFPC